MSAKLLLHHHRYTFGYDTGSAYIPPQPGVTWIKQQEVHYEKLPVQTAKGITFSYLPDSLANRAEPDPALLDKTYRRRYFFGFTPAGREEINGIAFGLLSENRKNHKYNIRDTLVTRGLNIELHPMSLLFGFFLPYIGEIGKPNYSYERYLQESAPEWETKMYGVNLSLLHIGSRRIYGLNIAPTMTVVDEMHGLTITPIVNYAMVQQGTMISLYNNSKRSRGFQLGLINTSRDHRGLQIGLWNTNAKRRLPFINWQLKAADSSLQQRD
ncbi:hypothetical protein MKQ70_17700 [Chitinophaga sedimenti]|uniref:LA_2272 family surface repeat-containing protein n=1 Tax=Chitinophaga sedimenti TaxID=2033606 RepID=UPI0020048040|nr:hypothetical protein [Chitinophaga sedimenti]MCK7556754.1 hypothetical protein [Chitinophaga sedimenti]